MLVEALLQRLDSRVMPLFGRCWSARRRQVGRTRVSVDGKAEHARDVEPYRQPSIGSTCERELVTTQGDEIVETCARLVEQSELRDGVSVGLHLGEQPAIEVDAPSGVAQIARGDLGRPMAHGA